MRRFLLALTFVVTACSGSNSSSSTPDAGSEPAPRTFGARCAKPDNMATDCDSHVCTDSIDKAGGYVCSQQCTMLKAEDPSCPVGADGRHFCNMKGYCKP